MEFIELVRLYCELMKMEQVDIRVIETVVQMIMSYVPMRIETNLGYEEENKQ